jgi:hypothetical protein
VSTDNSDKPAKKSSNVVLVSIVGGVVVLSTCCCGVGIGTWYSFFRTGGLGVPGVTVARLDTNNFENTRAWAEKTVAKLKDLDAKGNRAATDAEVAKIEKEMRDAIVGKEIHWSMIIAGVRDDGEVDLEQFHGKDDGKVPEGPDAGKPRRKLYFRVYLEAEVDAVRVGNEITREQARKGSPFPLERKVIEANIRQRDSNWSSRNRYTNSVERLDTFCVDIIVQR